MAKSLADLQLVLSRIKPWVAAAAVLGLILLIYYVLLGMRYLDASSQVDSLNSEVRQLTTRLRRTTVDEEALSEAQAAQERRLEAVNRLFTAPTSDELVGVLSTVARENSVLLARVSVPDEDTVSVGDVPYRSQRMSINLRGTTPNIYRFLSRLQEEVVMVRVDKVNLSGLEGSPTIQVDLLFLLSPSATGAE